MVQTKEQDKSPETDPNEMEITQIFWQLIQNNHYEDAQQAEKNNTWTK